jgi:glucose-6-phosphate-specific signal transduction histidine kinase
LRHAGPAKAIVTLSYAPKLLTIEVTDDGKSQVGSPGPEAGAGKGLLGMRERAEALGGELAAGPVAAGGFKVRAELPCPPEEPPAGPGVPAGLVGVPSGPPGQGVVQVPRPAL